MRDAHAVVAVIGELAAYAALILFVPAILTTQKIHDWWSDPINVFWRRVWITEHLRGAPQPSPRRATLDRDSACVHRAAVEGGSDPRSLAGGRQQPAAADASPDSAATGPQPHPRDEEVAGAAEPRTVAPATQCTGAAAQAAPVRGVA